MKLKIVATGDNYTSTVSVVNAETGEILSGIQELKIEYNANQPLPVVTMKVFVKEIDLYVEQEFINKNVLSMK